ncbi:MAG TPA: cyclic pyranopterin monophosphate synthase MoaC [Pirellulaceae bacterium]|nr:cyclic pyranopterin monophosphate synthase MoaC [Pirellulaceae bacterium]HMO92764.1 cyclic pyranopterin monophosphate synthase MoaC [Pirellulaceae bacterium]HMP69346.1 cyclic pyranopterin monophosphate synthase MoaC [Pirellulaceae bacterium]
MSVERGFSHFDQSGKAQMVDVGQKPESQRVAVAVCRMHLRSTTLDLIRQGTIDKGDVLGISRVAGIMAAKKTADLIPLCHYLAISSAAINFEFLDAEHLEIRAQVTANDRTGVEMESLTSVAIAALTIYDMCKSVDREIKIVYLGLESKSGGKSGDFKRGCGTDE